jgi:hypothetical protein
MFDGHRVIVVTPAGRRRYLSVLLPHVVAQRGIVDRWELWENTPDDADLAWLRETAAASRGFVRCVPGSMPINPDRVSDSIHPFHRRCTEPGTIYVRIDDDVIWLAPDCIASLCRFRLAEREPFVVYANVVNNGLISHIHQRIGALPIDAGRARYLCQDPTSWGDGAFAVAVHRAFFAAHDAGDLDRFRFGMWRSWEPTRISINVIAWLGDDFAPFGGEVPLQEEEWLAVTRPRELGRTTAICGQALASHYAYWPQRAVVDAEPWVLERYRALAGLSPVVAVLPRSAPGDP